MPATIDALFEERAACTPGAPAVVVPAAAYPRHVRTHDTCATFQQLSERSSTLAAALRALGVAEGDIVAVCSGRAVGAVVAFLAVCKTGGAFLPVAPDDPPERVAKYMAQVEAKCLIIVQQEHCPDSEQCLSAQSVSPSRVEVGIAQYGGVVVHVHDYGEVANISRPSDERRTQEVALPPSTMYVLFTSGSTGSPQAVAGTHAGLINRCTWSQREYPWKSTDVCCARTPFTFVDSVAELFGPLIFGPSGCVLHLLPDRCDGFNLRLWVSSLGITRLLLVPALLDAFIDAVELAPEDGQSLRVLSVSGEQLSRRSALRTRKLLPHCSLLNLYGSTEVSGDVTCCNVSQLSLERGAASSVPIGLPIANCQVILMDDARQKITRAGVAGEIYVGGPHVANGYVLDAARTTEQFVRVQGVDGVVFRTGDWAKRSTDGQLVWIGRTDRLVKVRGQRIHLEEVESTILTAGVAEVAAMVDQYGNLCAFVSPAHTAETTLRRHCVDQLPSHMVPVRFRLLSKLPRTPSGKLDRQAMLAIMPRQQAACDSKTTACTTACAVEDAIALIWQEMLTLPRRPRRQDSWFELGGTSLVAFPMLERITITADSLLGYALPLTLANLVADPTLGGVCDSVTRTEVTRHKRARTDHEMKALATIGDSHIIRQRLSVDATAGWLLVSGNARSASRSTAEVGPVWSIGSWDGRVQETKEGCCRTNSGSSSLMQIMWRYNARACVDGTPAWLMTADESATGVVIVASHAGVVAAVSVDSGIEYWRVQLSGRVDAPVSVCVNTTKGELLACVGSYNGTVYFLRTTDGSVAWEYQTGAEVRCMACVEYGDRGIVWCGSHDHYLYALSVKELPGQCLFTLQCQGSIMSTPVCVQPSRATRSGYTNQSLVVVASQDGSVQALGRGADDRSEHSVYRQVWTHTMGAPVFAGLVATDKVVIVPDVTGNVHGLAVPTGQVLWERRCGADAEQDEGIFATPSILRNEVVISLRSGRLESLRISDGLLLWSILIAESPLTGLAIDKNLFGSDHATGCVAAADGNVLIFQFSLGSHLPPMLKSRVKLPAQVFCTPLMYGRRVLVGCRDDALHCLELGIASQAHRPSSE